MCPEGRNGRDLSESVSGTLHMYIRHLMMLETQDTESKRVTTGTLRRVHVIHGGECRWRGPPRSDQLCLWSLCAGFISRCVPCARSLACSVPASSVPVCRVPLQSLCAVCRLPMCLPHSLAEEPSSSSQTLPPAPETSNLVTSVNPCVLCESL